MLKLLHVLYVLLANIQQQQVPPLNLFVKPALLDITQILGPLNARSVPLVPILTQDLVVVLLVQPANIQVKLDLHHAKIVTPANTQKRAKHHVMLAFQGLILIQEQALVLRVLEVKFQILEPHHVLHVQQANILLVELQVVLHAQLANIHQIRVHHLVLHAMEEHTQTLAPLLV